MGWQQHYYHPKPTFCQRWINSLLCFWTGHWWGSRTNHGQECMACGMDAEQLN